jgi:hypothetical protein
MTKRATTRMEALPGPFAVAAAPHGIVPSRAVSDLVHAQVAALLAASPAFYELPLTRRQDMQRDLEKIAVYSAALLQDEWATASRLGQTPMRVDTVPAASSPARVQALADEKKPPPPPPPPDVFDTRAAGAVGGITKDVLNAVSFPTFVADLIKGTFQAIVNASIQQMEAYGKLLADVAKTVDQFMADNITDNNARDYLVQSHPEHFRIEAGEEGGARVRVREGSDEAAKPDFKATYGLNEDVAVDDDTAEQVLVPAARRRLAQSRQSMLSTMMLMGINRIVVTSGRIYAKMGFHIDARDTGAAQSASQYDYRRDQAAFAHGFFGFGGGGAATRTSVAYVSSTKRDSSDEINVSTDLTGEVELKFKSDYFPMERFAKPEMVALIQGRTPNPQANVPVAEGRQKQAGA